MHLWTKVNTDDVLNRAAISFLLLPARALSATALFDGSLGLLRRHRNMLEDGHKTELEVMSRKGRWYIAQLIPYRVQGADTDGVILTFICGYAATSRIREYTPTHEIPIVMMSGHAEPAAQVRAFAAGCTEHLVKPFSLHGFDSMVNRYLYADKAKPARAV